MVVCGDNSLAQRLTKELATVYGQHVTVVLPSLRGGDHGPRIAGLVGAHGLSVDAVEAQIPDDAALLRAGLERAASLALTSGDDQLNIHIALRARRINPEVHLVIRMFNRTLGRYLEDLLDRAARVRGSRRDADPAARPATTVLSDADTAAPSLVAAAVVGSDKVLYADGLLLRAKERTLGSVARRSPLCTLALLPGTEDDDEGTVDDDRTEPGARQDGGSGDAGGRTDEDVGEDAENGDENAGRDAGREARTGARAGRGTREGREARGHGDGPTSRGDHSNHSDRSERGGTRPDTADGPVLLPPEEELAQLPEQRGAVVLEAITRRPRPAAASTPRLPRVFALKSLFSRRLRYGLLGMTVVVLVLAVLLWLLTGGTFWHAGYVTLLDVLAIDDPAVDKRTAVRVLQLLAALAGMLLLPLLLAVVLESYGSFREAAALPDPPHRLSGHVVLLGLGKVGTRVLDRLLELDIPVVCIERDIEARGIALARRHRVPTLIADVTQEGVLESARIKRSRALLALTSSDGTNLEASLYARQVKPELRVVMRLFDDAFASTVYRTLRDTYPGAQTRSRSVSALAAPAFAGAMMGRQVLGAIPVGRRVLVFATVDVRDNPLLEGRTVAEAFRRESWRVVALDTADEGERRDDLGSLSPSADPRAAGQPGAPAPGAPSAGPAPGGPGTPSGPPGSSDPRGSAPSSSGLYAAGAGELEWRLHPGYVLKPSDRVVVAATRRGLTRLLAAGPGRGLPPMPSTGEHLIPDSLRLPPPSRTTPATAPPRTQPPGEDAPGRPVPDGAREPQQREARSPRPAAGSSDEARGADSGDAELPGAGRQSDHGT